MRRPLIVLFLVAVVAGVAWWLWQWQGGAAQGPDPWSAVPEEAVAVLEVSSPLATWERITGTSQFWGTMDTTRTGRAWSALFTRFAESTANTPAIARYLTDHSMLMCFAQGGEDWPDLVVIPMPNTPEATALLGAGFKTNIPAGFWSGTNLNVTPDSAFPALVLGWEKGVLLVGVNADEVGAARKRINGHRSMDTLRTKARATFSAGSDAHLLVRTASASRFLGNATGVFPNGVEPKGWMAFDVRVRPGAVLLNGVMFPENPAALAVLRHQDNGAADLLQVLPPGVDQLRTLNITNAAQAVKDLTGSDAEGRDFDAAGSWVKGSIGVAEMDNADGSTGRWAVLGTDAPVDAEKALSSLCPETGCVTTSYRGVEVRQMEGRNTLARLFGPDFRSFVDPLWCILGDHAIFAENPGEMRAAIDAWTDRNSLALDPRSGDFFGRYATDATYGWWADAARKWPKGEGALASMKAATGGCLLQLVPRTDGAFSVTFCAQFAPTGPGQAGALWTTAMGAPLEGPPVLVKDYLSKTVQILAQDKDHRLSLISCTGKVLWQRPLDGPLLGGVEQVDRYKNGKLQMVMGTAKQVYMIDRLGRDVEGFPVKLSDSAAAPLSVMDYDKNKDYRILVPLENGRLQNIGPDGRPVQGWNDTGVGAPAIASAEHARIQGLDYLILPLRDGNVEVLDRRGGKRYAPKLHMDHVAGMRGSRKSMEIGGWRLMWEDSAGAVLGGALNGGTDTLDKAKSGISTLIDLKEDGHLSVLRTTSSTLSAAGDKGALFSVSFPNAASAKAFPVPLSDGTEAIGLVLPEQDQVRLYTAEGELWKGFPLVGSVAFSVADINLDGVLELVTANREGVVTVYALPAWR